IEIGCLQFHTDEFTSESDRLVSGASNTGKWIKHVIAFITPQANAALYRAELQWTDVALIVVFTRRLVLKRVALLNAVPDRARPSDPLVIGDVRLDLLRIPARLTELDDVVRQRRT